MATKTLTKEQWQALEDKMATPYGYAHLMVDGYKLSLQIHKASKTALKYEMMVYINGEWRAAWNFEDCEERRRFYRQIIRSAHSAEWRKELKKESKKTLKMMQEKCGDSWNPDKKVTQYTPYWPTFKPFRRHLEANNDSIELLED